MSLATWVAERVAERWLPDYKKQEPPMTTIGGTVLGSTQQASYQMRTAKNMAQYGYMNNVTVYRAINIIAQSCASVDWRVYKVADPNAPKKQRVPIANHPLALLIEKPNKNKARSSFIEQLISYWMISGTNYLLASFPSDTRQPDSRPQALYNLRPDLITLLAGGNTNGDVAYFRYNISGGYSSYNSDIVQYPKYIDYPAWKVLPLRFFNPLDELAGLSVIQVAAAVVERQNAGEEWNFSLMKNMARPSGAFVAATDFSDEARARMKREVFQKYGRGKNTAGMPMLLENGLTYIQLAINPVDADWLNSDAAAGRKIASAIGVDPLLLQDKQYSTYNNELEAKLAMWELTCFPLMEKLKDELNGFLTPFYGRGVEIDYDREPIESLRRNRQLESVTTIAEWNTGLRSFNDAATDLDIQTTPNDKDDFYRFGPSIFVRRNAISDFLDAQEALWRQTEQILAPPPQTTVTQIGPDGKPVGPDGKPIAALQGANPLQPQQPVNPLKPGQNTTPSVSNIRLNKPSPFQVPTVQNLKPYKDIEERDIIYRKIDAFRQQWYGHFTQGVKSYFDSELITLLQAIGHNRDIAAIKASVLATLQLHTSQLQTVLAGYYASIADAAARRIGEQFGTKTTVFQKTSIETLGVYAGKNISAIAATTQKHIEDIFVAASSEEKDVGAVAQKLRELYQSYTTQRAEAIAMNETLLAHNVGSYIAAKQVGLPLYKTWICSRDLNVRSEHAGLDGQRTYLEEPYVSGNVHLLFPKDDSYGAPPDFLIGCRCAEMYTVDFHPESRIVA